MRDTKGLRLRCDGVLKEEREKKKICQKEGAGGKRASTLLPLGRLGVCMYCDLIILGEDRMERKKRGRLLLHVLKKGQGPPHRDHTCDGDGDWPEM